MSKALGAAALGAAMAATPAMSDGGSYGKYEAPAYVLQERIGEAEVRAYAGQTIAQVAVEGSRRGSLNQGFRILAGYIFGGNEGATSVAMTSPVTQSTQIDMTSPVSQSSENGTWTVTFMMPSEYSIATLPRPKDDRVQLIQTEPRNLLVLPFSGLAGSARLDAKARELRAVASDAGIQVAGDPIYMFYDDPMTLPWKRRNEVAFEIPG